MSMALAVSIVAAWRVFVAARMAAPAALGGFSSERDCTMIQKCFRAGNVRET